MIMNMANTIADDLDDILIMFTIIPKMVREVKSEPM